MFFRQDIKGSLRIRNVNDISMTKNDIFVNYFIFDVEFSVFRFFIND